MKNIFKTKDQNYFENTIVMLRRRLPLMLSAVAIAASYGGMSCLRPGSVAAKQRYTKTEAKVVALKSKAKDTALPTPAQKAASERASRTPSLRFEQFKRDARIKVQKLNDDSITVLVKLIKVTDDQDPRKPDLYFRLAEHYREKKVSNMFKARDLDEQIYATNDVARKRSLKNKQKGYEEEEKKWMLESIKAYLMIAQNDAFSNYTRMDQVLFSLADMLNQAKRRDKARIFFGQLIRNHPQSPFIPDAYLSFAEYYFNEEGDPEKALRLYEQVGKHPDSPLLGYAMYKQAWCWINLNDPKKAMAIFVRIIESQGSLKGTKKGKSILVRESQKDLVKAYAMVGTAQRAWPFFQRTGKTYAKSMLERLGDLYYDQGKSDESIYVYRKMISLEPKSPKICEWQYKIAKASLSGKPRNEQVVEIKRLGEIYSRAKKGGKLSAEQDATCRDQSSGLLRELATTWHREAQKTQNNDTYALSEYLYKAYLTSFPDAKDAYPMNYYYGELLFRLKKWEPAAEQYMKVVKMDAKGKYKNDAAYGAVVSWKNALDVTEEINNTEKNSRGRDFKPKPLTAKQKKMLEAFDMYLTNVPNSPERVKIMYRKARIYYDNNMFDQAVPVFGEIATKHSSDQLAPFSANLLLDSLNITENYEDIELWVDRFSKHPELNTGEFQTTLATLRRGIKRKRLEQYQKEGRYLECGKEYAKLANDYPDDPRWAELAFNSAKCFEAAKSIGNAISIRDKLIAIKPDDPLAQQALYMVGANYHALAWYERASDYYEKFAMQYPGEKEAPDALQNAIVFRLGRSEYKKAAKDVDFFARTFGKPQWGKHGGVDRKIQALVKIGNAYWASSCPSQSADGSCIRVDRVRAKRTVGRKSSNTRKQCGPATKSRVTVVKRDSGRLANAMDAYKKAIALSSSGRKVSLPSATKDEAESRQSKMAYASAEARFHLAEVVFERFLGVSFPSGLDFSEANPGAKKKSLVRFNKYINEKGRLLNEARSLYQNVIKTAVAHWAIAASARIGQLYQNFADALYTAPVPKPDIPQFVKGREAREDYKMAFTDAYCDTLEDKAGPLEAKAVQGLATCTKKSTELSWFNDWSILCEAELNQILPAEYPIASEIRAKPGYLSLKRDLAGVTTELN